MFGDALARAPLRALSADSALLQLLPAKPQRARVHSVFARVINVEFGAYRLMALAHRSADDAPDSIVVDLDAWSALNVEPGTEVQLSGDRIDIGEHLSIAVVDARRWRARLSPYAQDETTLRTNLPVARNHLEHHGSGLVFRRSSACGLTGLDRAVAAAFGNNSDGLCRALASGNNALTTEHVGALVGLGPGLTPSGDDFLLGLLAALNIPGSPAHACRGIGAHVVECAARQTPLISAAALRHAAAGRVRASVISLCDTLMHGSSTTLMQALDAVMRIGSSSGSEIALGVLAGFRLHLTGARARRKPSAYDGRPGIPNGA